MANPLRKVGAYLGFNEDREMAPEYAQQVQRSQPANITQLHPTAQQQRVALPATMVGGMVSGVNQIFTARPREFSEVKEIVAQFRAGVPVIINMTQLKDPEARRMIDFAAGLTQGLAGRIDRVEGKIFLITPEMFNVLDGDNPEAD